MSEFVRDVSLALVRVHILHHAGEGRVFGVGLMKELARHGYRIGPGTLYPLLHRLQADGLLTSESVRANGSSRKYYVITRKGRLALTKVRAKVAELAEEALPH